MKRSKLFVMMLALALILAACSGSSEKDVEIVEQVMATEKPTEKPADTEVPPTPEPTEEPTEEPVMLPVSMVTAPLGEGEYNAYKLELPGMMPAEFEDSELPALPGSVTANWFTSGDVYVVGYYGLDLETSGPLCPGNSILTGGGWKYTTNAPTAEGACDTFPTLTDDPDVGPVICHGVLFYNTNIPSSEQGTLYGTIEVIKDGYMLGITSQAESTTEMLEIDLAETCN